MYRIFLPFLLINSSLFFVFSGVAFLYLYPLAIRAMGGESDIIGWIMGVFSIAAVLSRPFMGKIAARRGEYRVMSGGIGVILLASLGYTVVQGVGPAVFLVRILHGIGFSAFIAGSFSWIARSFPRVRRGEAYGIVGASLMGAVALGPPLGEYLIRKYGFYGLYLGASGAAALAWIALFAARTSFRPSGGEKGKNIRYLPLLGDRSFLFVLFSCLIFAHCQSSVFNFLALIAGEKGAGSGRFFFLSFLLAILVLLTMGRLIDRYGKLIFLRLSYPLFSAGILLIPVVIGERHFLLSALLYGAGMGLLFPAHNALAADHGSGDEKAAVMSLFTAVYDTGFITGAVLSGWIGRLTSLDTLFFSAGVLALVGLAVAWVSPIRKD
jgi:MFS family permease